MEHRILKIRRIPFYSYIYCEVEDKIPQIEKNKICLYKTEFGVDFGMIIDINNKRTNSLELKEFVRIASEKDLKRIEKIKERNRKALKTAREKAKEHNLSIKIFGARFMFDGKRVLFYFVSPNRIDFREYVKDLAKIFKRRIELRQVSCREAARMIGGIGICGREFCCIRTNLKPRVSIKMAKEQNLSLNTIKLCGPCGKILCCIAFENQMYMDMKKELPFPGSEVCLDISDFPYSKHALLSALYPDKTVKGIIKGVNIFRKTVYLKLKDGLLVEMPAEKIKNSISSLQTFNGD